MMNPPKGFDIAKNVYKRKLELFEEAVTLVLLQKYISCFCAGPPGIGKTFIVEKLKALREFRHLRIEFRKLDAVHFIDTLYDMQDANCVIVLDDKQGMFESGAMLEHLLNALDSDKDRKRMIRDLRKLPEDGGNGKGTFEVKCRFIIMQNQDIFGDDYKPPDRNLSDKVAALRSRLMYNRIAMPTDDDHYIDLYNYICWVMVSNYKFREIGLKWTEANEVLAYFADNFHGFKQIGIRTLETLAQARKNYSEHSYHSAFDQHLVDGFLFRKMKDRVPEGKRIPPYWSIGRTALVPLKKAKAAAKVAVEPPHVPTDEEIATGTDGPADIALDDPETPEGQTEQQTNLMVAKLTKGRLKRKAGFAAPSKATHEEIPFEKVTRLTTGAAKRPSSKLNQFELASGLGRLDPDC